MKKKKAEQKRLDREIEKLAKDAVRRNFLRINEESINESFREVLFTITSNGIKLM